MQKDRNLTIDYMRCLGILLIILAHSSPPNLIFQLRNFDVVMMVIIISLSYKISTGKRKIRYKDYLIKRTKRLILPTYLFLVIYYFISFILSILKPELYSFFNFRTIISSFLLLDGFGYIWIIRIYFLLSMSLPFIMKLESKIRSNYIFFFICFFMLCFQELMIIYFYNERIIMRIFDYLYFDIFGYILIGAISIRGFFNKGEKEKLKLVLIVIFLFVILSNFFNFFNLQGLKYPPRLYYLLYGLMCTMILYFVINRYSKKTPSKCEGVILFISNYSLELYFWHIIYIYILKGIHFIDYFNWYEYYLLLLYLSLFTTYMQVKYVPKLFISKGMKKVK